MLSKRVFRPALKFASIAAMALTLSAQALASPKDYFDQIRGQWSGSGAIIAGKFKDTQFTCKFDGESLVQTGMKIDGSCNVGIFGQPMNAIIQKAGASYRGKFLDGEKGTGLDVTSGKFSGDKFVVGIKRNKLKGLLVASLEEAEKMKVTISVDVDGRLVPVITMKLDRVGDNIITSGTKK